MSDIGIPTWAHRCMGHNLLKNFENRHTKQLRVTLLVSIKLAMHIPSAML